LERYSLIQNILLGLTLAAPIGPVNLEIIKRGLNSGFKQAFLTGMGAMCADTTYLILIFFGLTSFLNFFFIKIFLGIEGSFILIYLGVLSVRDFFSTANQYRKLNNSPSVKRLFKSSFVTGYVLAISSPMTIVWWTGVFGALLAAQTQTQTNISAFFSCFSILLGCFLWVSFLSTALHWGKKIISENFTILISLFAGSFLILFGIYFLYRTYTLVITQ
jgi:threonine/homoserine/homoserine lactone efflux protein